MHLEDNVRSKWCVEGPMHNVWVDASSLAIRVLLEMNEATIEDAS